MRRKSRFWGVRTDSIRHDGCPWDSHVDMSDRHEEVVVFSSAVSQC